MEVPLEDVRELLRGAGWEEERGPPPRPHLFIVREGYLERVTEADRVCRRSPRPVLYLAAEAEGVWYVVGPVPPTPHGCIPVTFKKRFPDGASAVGELVEYGMKIFRIYPRWFEARVLKAAGLCERLEFQYLCASEEELLERLRKKTAAKTPEAGASADAEEARRQGARAGEPEHAASSRQRRSEGAGREEPEGLPRAEGPPQRPASAESQAVSRLEEAARGCFRRLARGGCIGEEDAERFADCILAELGHA
jgi:hypothetical protein